MAKVKSNLAIERGRARRVASTEKRRVRFKWMLDKVMAKVSLDVESRVRLATVYLHSQVVLNISRPVMKTVRRITRGPNKGKRRTVVSNRSKAGEYPKADTTRLMADVFQEVAQESPGRYVGYVGTTLDYGVILETNSRLDRRWLTRTLFEEADNMGSIIEQST